MGVVIFCTVCLSYVFFKPLSVCWQILKHKLKKKQTMPTMDEDRFDNDDYDDNINNSVDDITMVRMMMMTICMRKIMTI